MRILVVEDEHKIANSIKKGLEQEKYAVDVASFFGGIKYQQAKTPAQGARGQFANGQNRTGGLNGQVRQGMGRPIVGDIVSADASSITVKLTDGSSKIVLLGTNVTVSKTSDTTKDELKTGAKVGVFGTENSDGSITAQNIQLNPMFRGFGASPSPSSK